MRRSGPGGTGGAGGFSKPPPAPLTHPTAGRARLHAPEVNGSMAKDRFGSPRERSPSLVSNLPMSPSHPSSREKSPNPASQDLHDCSMCLSAYIQSLNTVCGTACRLSQCLAQVSSECSHGEGGLGPGQGASQPVREAADAWEGVARAVGVASAAVKTQMLVLLQEAQSRQEVCEGSCKQEVQRVAQAMLTAFLGLQYQFSAVVIDRFTGILQCLRDDSQCPSSQAAAGMHTSKPCYSAASSHMSDHSQPPVSSQYLPQLPGQPSLLPASAVKGMLVAPLLESPAKEDKCQSRHPSGNHSRHPSATPSWSSPSSSNIACSSTMNFGSNSSYGSNINLNMASGNTLSPVSCYGLYSHLNGGGSSAGWHNDAISRRWSMGGPSTEGWERNSSLGPFSLIANRRWSVPEASEHDLSSMGDGDPLTDLYGSCGLQGDWGGTTGSSIASWGSRGGLHVPSRDSSVTRSPSHSRSVTPDPGRQSSFISTEELQEVIDLLSIPISLDTPAPSTHAWKEGKTDGGGGGGTSGGKSSGGRIGGCDSGGRIGDCDSSARVGDHDNGGRIGDCDSGGRVGDCDSGGRIGGCDSGGADRQGSIGAEREGASAGSKVSSGGMMQGMSPIAHSPTHHPTLTQLFEEATQQQQHQQLQSQQQKSHTKSSQKAPISEAPQSAQQQISQQNHQFCEPLQYHHHSQQQQLQQPYSQPGQHQQYHQSAFSSSKSSTPQHSVGEVVVESSSQVSTPIWPPSGIAPGVTLTECSNGEEKPSLPLWTDGIGCERRNPSSHARDTANRASWPAATTLLWAGLDGLRSAGEGEGDGSVSPTGLPQYRRHSTDTTHLSLNPATLPIAKTRSSDNITGSDMNHPKSGCLDSNLQNLLLLNSILPASSPSSPTSQYSLFSSTT